MVGESLQEEGWVVCRVFKKKNYHKALESPSTPPNGLPRNDGVLDQILMYMGRSSSTSSSCKQEFDPNMPFPNHNHSPPFMHLPELQSPTMHPPSSSIDLIGEEMGPTSDWATLDRLVASQLNGQSSKHFSHYGEEFSFSFDHELMNVQDSGCHRPGGQILNQDVSSTETDLWNFARSSSSSSSDHPLCHLSV